MRDVPVLLWPGWRASVPDRQGVHQSGRHVRFLGVEKTAVKAKEGARKLDKAEVNYRPASFSQPWERSKACGGCRHSYGPFDVRCRIVEGPIYRFHTCDKWQRERP